MKFHSAKGSTVEISGKHGGIFTIDFDWFEEGCCCDAEPHFNNDLANPKIMAHCPCHETEYVKLERVWPEQIQEWPE